MTDKALDLYSGADADSHITVREAFCKSDRAGCGYFFDNTSGTCYTEVIKCMDCGRRCGRLKSVL